MAASPPPSPPIQLNSCCTNCLAFEWKQPDPAVILKQCSKCKVVKYCGVECQSEHWKLVHKGHCKKLARAKAVVDMNPNLSFSPGFSLFLLAGLQESTEEKLFKAVQKIVAKMRNISHPAFQFHPAEMLKMDAVITENLSEICTSKVIGGRFTRSPIISDICDILLKIIQSPIPLISAPHFTWF